MQTHGCLQLAEEADREHKKVADKITERTEVVKVPVPPISFAVYRLVVVVIDTVIGHLLI
jgi:hypothetical protein